MPYKIVGRGVYHKVGTHWKLKQRAHSRAKANATLKLLRGIENGWKPTLRRK